MMHSGTIMVGYDPQLRLQDKGLSLLAWAIGVSLLVTVGWMVLEPLDPHGAVTIGGTQTAAILVLAEMLALSVIVSALATGLIGKKLPDAGVFAVALGLAACSLRGATAEHLLISITGADASARSSLAWKLAFEGCVWFSVIAAAMFTSGVTIRWLGKSRSDADDLDWGSFSLAEASIFLPWLGPAPDDSEDREWVDGLKVTAVSLFAAAILFRVLAAGLPWSSITHGQTYFALIAASYLGTSFAYRSWQVRSALWGCLAPPLLCLGGFVYSALASSSQGPYSDLANIPPSTFYRALPIQYVSVGTAAAVASFWAARRRWAMNSLVADSGPRKQARV